MLRSKSGGFTCARPAAQSTACSMALPAGALCRAAAITQHAVSPPNPQMSSHQHTSALKSMELPWLCTDVSLRQ